MGKATKKSLEQAFMWEAKAYFRLKAFAIKADAQGYRHETAFSLFLSTP